MAGTRISLGDSFVGPDCPMPVAAGVGGYVVIGGNRSEAVLGEPGARGDRLHALICVVEKSGLRSARSEVKIQDGEELAITVLPNGVCAGTHRIEFGAPSRHGPWSICTGPDVRVIALGEFS